MSEDANRPSAGPELSVTVQHPAWVKLDENGHPVLDENGDPVPREAS